MICFLSVIQVLFIGVVVLVGFNLLVRCYFYSEIWVIWGCLFLLFCCCCFVVVVLLGGGGLLLLERTRLGDKASTHDAVDCRINRF